MAGTSNVDSAGVTAGAAAGLTAAEAAASMVPALVRASSTDCGLITTMAPRPAEMARWNAATPSAGVIRYQSGSLSNSRTAAVASMPVPCQPAQASERTVRARRCDFGIVADYSCFYSFQVLKEALATPVALRGVSLHHLRHHLADLGRNAGVYLSQRYGDALRVRPQVAERVLDLERFPAGEHLVRHYSEREDVRPGAQWPARDLLG